MYQWPELCFILDFFIGFFYFAPSISPSPLSTPLLPFCYSVLISEHDRQQDLLNAGGQVTVFPLSTS
jgi:hypothetical protein